MVHAPQVLQRLSDPVGALRERRRVGRPDGVGAVRDSDYAAMVWAPLDPRLDRWLALYHRITRRNAAEADAAKTRVLAAVSHDLRQPVHALGLFAATLQRRLQQSPDEPLARNLLRAVDGLERSFNAMLDISRLDGGAVAPRLQTFPLRDMFRRLHMQYAGQAEFAGLGLRFSPGGKSVTSDPQLLERIVGNLVQWHLEVYKADGSPRAGWPRSLQAEVKACLLYTSDAADERSSVDLGGRRIIKKKNSRQRVSCTHRSI